MDSSSTCVLPAFQNEFKGPPNDTQSLPNGTLVAVWLPPVKLFVSQRLTGGTESHFVILFAHFPQFDVRRLSMSIAWLKMELRLAQNVLTISLGILGRGDL